MSYTTISQVAGMFPTFTRNGPKGPNDPLIQNYIDDEAGEINAILQRRFSEAISAMPGASLPAQFAAWVGAFSADQTNLLEKINRLGAAGEMGKIFEAMGIAIFGKIGAEHEASAQILLGQLNARDEEGKPVEQGGDFDYLFDSQAKVETPRPQMGGIAGGDQYPGQYDGSSSVFKKWDRRES